LNITNQQLINPGTLDLSPEHKKQLARFKEAVRRARFLEEKEKRRWILLGYILTTKQLLEAERMIITEDLKTLKTKQDLEKIKSNIK